MFREILETFLKFVKSRIIIAFAMIIVMSVVLLGRVFNLQIKNSQNYVEQYSQKMEKTRYYNSTRGNIYDCNGELLAYNVSVYSVVIEDILDSSAYKGDKLNEIINTTVKLIEKHGDSIDTDFPLQYVNGHFEWQSSLSENSRLRFLKDIFGVKDLDTEDEKKSDTTPKEAFEWLAGDKKFSIDLKKYTEEEAYKIAVIRYNLSLNAYQKYISTTIATEVSEETVAAVYESADVIPGVKISETSKRVYNNGLYFAHVIGYTGKISDEQLTTLNTQITDKNDMYELNDIVGKSGIEASMEIYLSGTKGYEKVLVDNMGLVQGVVESKDATAGNDIYLTIDSKLQIGIYHLIEEQLAGILVDKIIQRTPTAADEAKWLIPIKDVYFQMINNNIVDLEIFNREQASQNEKNVYAVLSSKKESVLSHINTELYNPQAASLASLGKEYNEYYTFIFNMLSESSYGVNLIPKSGINTEDEMYKKWMRDEISLREILLYAIDANWIDTSLLNVESNYIDKETIYTALTEYIKEYLAGEKAFDKLLYKYLIENENITGAQVCKLLYDQNILPYDENAYAMLTNGTLSAYDFMINKIKALEITPAMIALEPCSATVTVVKPGTSDVLAMVSYPSYDNNAFSGSIDYETWTTLSEDMSSPLFERATKMRTAPGSTFKVLSSIAGMEMGIISSSSYISCKGIFDTVTPSPKCHVYPRSHGSINVVSALKHSCNCFFYEIGYRMSTKSGSFVESDGLSALKTYGSMVGLTEKSGVEVEEYAPLFSTTSPITSAIGQGSHSFTSVQLARYVNTIASDGLNYELTLIKSISSGNSGNVALQGKSVTKIQASQETLAVVTEGMVQASNSYSSLSQLPYRIASKTGTAQESANSPDHALVIGFAPYDNPEVSMSVMIQNGYSSSYASELLGQALKYYFNDVSLEEILNGNSDGPQPVQTTDTQAGVVGTTN